MCMCKACESSIRRYLKKHRTFQILIGKGNESVAFHFVRQLMLTLASMLSLGKIFVVALVLEDTSPQLCLCTQ